MPQDMPQEEELFSEVKKLLNLKNTEFIIDPDIEESICDTYSGDGITRCYLKRPEDTIHAFFEERSQRLWEK